MTEANGTRPSKPAASRRLVILAGVIVIGGIILVIAQLLTDKHPRQSPDDAGIFVNRASELGMLKPNQSGAPERLYIFENIGSGGALLDYDGDGWLDVLVANAGGVEVIEGPPVRLRRLPGPGTTLYRQESRGRFVDMTEAAGLRWHGWGGGVAVGDIDNDDDLDIFINAFGPNRFYLNRGDGTFTERAREAGLDHPGYGTSAIFVDYDRDGFLDLYVVHYVEFDFDAPPNDGAPCIENNIPISCGPTMHDPKGDVLFRNRGDGTFEDVTTAAGLGDQPGPYGLGVAAADVDSDGWPDIYVTNDTTANFLWRNRGDGTFEEDALFRGVALSENAQGQAGMGVDIADADDDGWLDILVTNYLEEPNAFYRNLGDGTFSDDSARSGLGRPAYRYMGWGTKFIDFDLDGILDVVAVNGHVHPRAAELGIATKFEQMGLLFRGIGEGRFENISATGGGDLRRARNHRGVAVGDLDGDGDEDLLVTLLDGPPLLLENTSVSGHSIGFILRGTDSNREGVGARVEVVVEGTPKVKEVSRGGSYLSSSDATLIFGTGKHLSIEGGSVAWPSGARQRFGALAAGSLYVITEGSAAARALKPFHSRD